MRYIKLGILKTSWSMKDPEEKINQMLIISTEQASGRPSEWQNTCQRME